MLKKSKVLNCLIVMVLSLALVAVCWGSEKATKYQITWGTAPAGGAWQVLGAAMLEDVTKANPNIIGSNAPIGGFANIIGVSEGKLQVAFSLSATLGDVWDGKGPFKKKGQLRNFRLLATLFPEPTQIVVFADSGINSVEQLKGKKITPGPRGSAIEQDTIRVLEAYGLDFKDFKTRMMSFEEAGQQMIDGHIDSIFYGAMVLPAPNIVTVSSQKPIRLLSMSDDKIQKVLKANKGTIPYTIPAGIYKGVDYPVKGIATICNIIVSEDMPEDIAYSIVKTIVDNFDRYETVIKAMSLAKKEDLGKDMSIPYHPGALKFYKEKGLVK